MLVVFNDEFQNSSISLISHTRMLCESLFLPFAVCVHAVTIHNDMEIYIYTYRFIWLQAVFTIGATHWNSLTNRNNLFLHTYTQDLSYVAYINTHIYMLESPSRRDLMGLKCWAIEKLLNFAMQLKKKIKVKNDDWINLSL